MQIQAIHLQSIGTKEMANYSLELLDLMLKEFPEKSELSSAFLQKAECLIILGEIEQSIDEIRNALQSEPEFLNVKTSAWLEIGWTMIIYQLSDLYEETINVLNEFKSDLMFPIDKYNPSCQLLNKSLINLIGE